ncbi:hypothetical protein D9M71_612920 [compost metagenome]
MGLFQLFLGAGIELSPTIQRSIEASEGRLDAVVEPVDTGLSDVSFTTQPDTLGTDQFGLKHTQQVQPTPGGTLADRIGIHLHLELFEQWHIVRLIHVEHSVDRFR